MCMSSKTYQRPATIDSGRPTFILAIASPSSFAAKQLSRPHDFLYGVIRNPGLGEVLFGLLVAPGGTREDGHERMAGGIAFLKDGQGQMEAVRRVQLAPGQRHGIPLDFH